MEIIPETKPQKKNKVNQAIETKNEHLIGTFTFVLILAGFILLSWLGIYGLYVSRM
jgi:hypothetical protein